MSTATPARRKKTKTTPDVDKAKMTVRSQRSKEQTFDRQQRKVGTLNLRCTRQIKDLVNHAASIRGQSVSEYVQSVITQQAEADVARSQIAHIAAADRKLFMDILTRTSPPTPTLKRAAALERRVLQGS